MICRHGFYNEWFAYPFREKVSYTLVTPVATGLIIVKVGVFNIRVTSREVLIV